MAMAGTCLFSPNLSPVFRRDMTSASRKQNRSPILKKRLAASMEKTSSASKTVEMKTTSTRRRSLAGMKSGEEAKRIQRSVNVEESEELDEGNSNRKSLKDYLDEAKDMIRSDGGPPRWFSPLVCGSRAPESPILLFLPGIDGVGLGLIMQHQGLGQIFDIWCLHIPVKDRTSFTGLVNLVEKTVRSESQRLPSRPIYLVGESLGACIALAVASLNPTVDLVLILANPATSFSKSQLQPLLPILEVMSDQLHLGLPYLLSLMMTGSHQHITTKSTDLEATDA